MCHIAKYFRQVRKVVGGSIGPLVQACLQMMCDLEDEDDWAVSDEPQEEDSDSNAVVAESALDRYVKFN